MADQSRKFSDSVETGADFFPPLVYSALTHYSSFVDMTDPTSLDFIPIRQTKENPKLFVVGLVPPATDITARLLDRSANVTDGPPTALPQGSTPTSLEPVTAITGPLGTGSQVDPKRTPITMQAFAASVQRVLPNATKEQAGVLWAHFAGENGSGGATCYGWNLGNVKHSQGSTVNYQALSGTWEGVSAQQAETMISSGLWVADDDPTHAKAVGPGKVPVKVAPGKESENPACWFNTYPNLDTAMSVFVENKYSGRYASSWQYVEAGDPDGYARALGAQGYYTASPDVYSKSLQFHHEQWMQSTAFEAAAEKGGASANATTWQQKGSANASQARKEQEKNGPKDLNTTEQGKRYQAAQQAEITSTLLALETMKNTPPLRMLVNPQSFKISSEKIVSDGNWTRNGPVIEHWGEQQDKMEFSGKIAAFMALDAVAPNADDKYEGGGPGLTRMARHYSDSYQNFMSLWLLYRNNAGLYLNGLEGSADIARLSMLGSIYVYYDGIMYFGSFDNFNITESDTAPHTLEYNIQFTVRASFLLDQSPRPEEGSYGAAAAKFFAKGPAISSSSTPSGPASAEQTRLFEEALVQQAAQRADTDSTSDPTPQIAELLQSNQGKTGTPVAPRNTSGVSPSPLKGQPK